VKAYQDYMDKITLDADVHQRVLDRLGGESGRGARLGAGRRSLAILAGGLLVVAVIVGIALALPRLQAQQPESSQASSGQLGSQTNSRPTSAVMIVVADYHPSQAVDSLDVTRVLLDDEQAARVLPDFTEPWNKMLIDSLRLRVNTYANYGDDGSFLGISAYQVDEQGDLVRTEEGYARTEILITKGDLPEELMRLVGKPNNPNLHGVPVYMASFCFIPQEDIDEGFEGSQEYALIQIAYFQLDDVKYLISISDKTAVTYDSESGRILPGSFSKSWGEVFHLVDRILGYRSILKSNSPDLSYFEGL